MARDTSYLRRMGRSGQAGGKRRHMPTVRLDAEAWRDSLSARKTRRELVRGLDQDAILALAEHARRLGDRPLALGLVRDMIVADIRPLENELYTPGEVMRRVLGRLCVWTPAAAHEYRELLDELIPSSSSLDDDTPIYFLARVDIDPLDLDTPATAAARQIVDGATYATTLSQLIQELHSASATAREREFDWLVDRLRLRFLPGDNGLGTLWRDAADRARHTPEFATELSREATQRVALRLACATDRTETVAALASGISDV
jgi:hypothetical protein